MKSSGRRIKSTGGRHANLPEDVRYDDQNHEQTACSQGRCVIRTNVISPLNSR